MESPGIAHNRRGCGCIVISLAGLVRAQALPITEGDVGAL